jgi:acyl CoA:acetate/3-ketoacid CoA transferase beta subunit
MECTRQEIMAVAAARELKDREVALIGTGLPMIAAYLAKFTHAPGLTLIFESGVVGAQPRGLAIGVGDFRLVSHCQKATSLYYALSLLQARRIDVGFLGAAEIDKYGNINSTAIGGYERPRVRLPGSGGANDIASLAKRVLLIVMHQRRKFVEQLNYLTTPGYLDGAEARKRAGLVGGGPSCLITDLAVLDFEPGSRRMRLQSLHPGVTVEEVQDNTGFALVIPDTVPATPLPSLEQVQLLRERIDPDGVYLSRPVATDGRK